jgi:hypothetical protein
MAADPHAEHRILFQSPHQQAVCPFHPMAQRLTDPAQAIYNSTAYREARKIGEKYARFRTFAVEGAGP